MPLRIKEMKTTLELNMGKYNLKEDERIDLYNAVKVLREKYPVKYTEQTYRLLIKMEGLAFLVTHRGTFWCSTPASHNKIEKTAIKLAEILQNYVVKFP